MVEERPRFFDELDRTERAEVMESFLNSGDVPVATNPTVDRDGEGNGEI